MSDTAEGPDWWQASDGKWYPPELYPADWPKPEGTVSDVAASDLGASDLAASDLAASDLAASDLAAADSAASGIDGADPDSVVDEASAGGGWPVAAAPETLNEPEAPVASPLDTTAIDPDMVDETIAAAPVTPPDQPLPPVDYGAAPAAPPSTYEAPVTSAPTMLTPEVPPAYGVPAAAPPAQSGGIGDNMTAVVSAVIGGILLIVGSMLEWGSVSGTTIDGVERSGQVTGFDSNGAGTLICGVLVILAALALAAGLRSVFIPLIIGGAAIAALGLFVFSLVDFLGKDFVDTNGLPQPDLDLTPSIGLWVVLIGALISGASATLVKLNDR